MDAPPPPPPSPPYPIRCVSHARGRAGPRRQHLRHACSHQAPPPSTPPPPPWPPGEQASAPTQRCTPTAVLATQRLTLLGDVAGQTRPAGGRHSCRRLLPPAMRRRRWHRWRQRLRRWATVAAAATHAGAPDRSGLPRTEAPPPVEPPPPSPPRAQRVRGRSAQRRQRRRLPRPPGCGPLERRRPTPCGSRGGHATRPRWGRPPLAPRGRGAGEPPGATARAAPPPTARSGGGGAPAPASAVGATSRGGSLPPSRTAHGRHRRAATPDARAGCGFHAPPTHGSAFAPRRQRGGRRTVSPPQSPARLTAPGGGGGACMDFGLPHSGKGNRVLCR